MNPYDATGFYDEVDSYDGVLVLVSGGGGHDPKGFQPWYKKPGPPEPIRVGVGHLTEYLGALTLLLDET